jgi:hypothetical protein
LTASTEWINHAPAPPAEAASAWRFADGLLPPTTVKSTSAAALGQEQPCALVFLYGHEAGALQKKFQKFTTSVHLIFDFGSCLVQLRFSFIPYINTKRKYFLPRAKRSYTT